MKKGGLTRGASHVQFWVNAWRDEANGNVQMASPRDQANFRAVLKPDSYLGGKILTLLDEPDRRGAISQMRISRRATSTGLSFITRISGERI
jgi:hypothetical protein